MDEIGGRVPVHRHDAKGKPGAHKNISDHVSDKMLSAKPIVVPDHAQESGNRVAGAFVQTVQSCKPVNADRDPTEHHPIFVVEGRSTSYRHG